MTTIPYENATSGERARARDENDHHCFCRDPHLDKRCCVCGITYSQWQARRKDKDGLYGCGHFFNDIADIA